MTRRTLLALMILLVACSTEADRVAEAGLDRIMEVNALLDQNKGNDEAALKALTDYEIRNREQIDTFRRKGNEVLAGLSQEEKTRHAEKWGPKVMEQRARTETLLRTFTAPRELVKIVGRVLN